MAAITTTLPDAPLILEMQQSLAGRLMAYVLEASFLIIGIIRKDFSIIRLSLGVDE